MSERGDWRDRGPTSESMRAAVLRQKQGTSRQAAQERALARWEGERRHDQTLDEGRAVPAEPPHGSTPRTARASTSPEPF